MKTLVALAALALTLPAAVHAAPAPQPAATPPASGQPAHPAGHGDHSGHQHAGTSGKPCADGKQAGCTPKPSAAPPAKPAPAPDTQGAHGAHDHH